MPFPSATRIAAGLGAGALVLLAVVTGESIEQDGWKWIAGVSGAVTLAFLAYDRWVWRWPLVGRIAEAIGHPVLRGTWKGSLRFESDADGKPGEVPIFLVVHQVFSEVELRALVSTSSSYSTATTIERPSRGQCFLWYIYRSEAGVLAQGTNRPHYGSSKLELVGSPVRELRGSYWTDRLGRGEMIFAEHSSELYGTYSEAERGSYRPGSDRK